VIPMHKEFKEAMGILDENAKVAIELQQIPDPDAMASAMYVAHIAERMGYKPTITHAGKLSHPQNIVMAKRLDIPLACYGQIDIDPTSFDAFVFVDHSGSTSQWYREGKIPQDSLVAIIDHHDLDAATPEGVFVDKRKVGSTSTILTEYLQQDAGDFDDDALEKVATALLLGIRSDTHGLKRNVSELDRDMHHYLLSKANMDLVDQIEEIDWPAEWMDHYGKAIHNRESKNGVTVASVGCIETGQRDVIPTIAEHLLYEKGVHTVYVWGLRPDIIDVSIRTRDPTYDFGIIPEKFPEGSGGGKEGAGGIQIPSPFGEESFVAYDRHSDTIGDVIGQEFRQRLLD